MLFFRPRIPKIGYTQLAKLLTAGARAKAKKMPVKVKLSLASIISTWFYIGRLPIAPGTFGALATYPIYYFCLHSSESFTEIRWTFLVCTIIITVIGVIAITRFQKEINVIDHQCIVVDEVIGQLTTFAIAFDWLYDLSRYLAPILLWKNETIIFFIGVLLFRYFDITKPLIISVIDNNMKNAIGVILDDIAAACFASATAYIIVKIAYKASGFIPKFL